MNIVDPSHVHSRFSLAGHPQVIGLLCPHCMKESTFTVKSWTQHAGRVAATETPCPRCNREVMFLNLVDHRDSPGEPTLYMHPDPVGRTRMDGADYLRDFSAPLDRTYDTVLKHYNNGDWGTAALMTKYLLEGLATRLLTDTHEGVPLTSQLEILSKGVELSAPLEDISDMLAPDGVFGRQLADATTVDQDTAQHLLELTEQLIAYLVVMPGTMADLKSRIASAPVPIRRKGNGAGATGTHGGSAAGTASSGSQRAATNAA